MLTANQQCPVERRASLLCRVETDFDALQGMREEWDATVSRLGAPVCMTFDWLNIWWKHYGHRKQLRIFLFFRESSLVSIMPLYLETFGIRPCTVRVARIVGANLPPRCFDPPVDPDCDREVFQRIFQELFANDGCDLLSLGPVSEEWSASAAVGAAGKTFGAVSYRATDVRTVFDLSAEFGAKLNSNKTEKHYLRALERQGNITTDVVCDWPRLEPRFEDFARQHAQQWRVLGKGGHFLAWPGAHAFHRALVRRHGRLGRVRFYRLLAGDEMIACCYTYVCGTTLSWELPSRVTGGDWDKFGLGKVVFIRMCQSALREGLSHVDAGLGEYTYKSLLGGRAVRVGTWRVVCRRRSARTKSAAFLAVAAGIKVVCNKIWYRRILPRLPEWAGRSQSARWLRFDA